MLPITNWKILAVDDEPDNLSLLADILSFFNVSITPCNSGAEALQMLEQQQFDMVLLDIQMPQMSGWDVIDKVRQHTDQKIRDTLVIAVTALAMPKDRDRITEAGFNGYIGKPLEVENFMLTLQQLTQREKSTGEGKSPSDSPQAVEKPTGGDKPPDTPQSVEKSTSEGNSSSDSPQSVDKPTGEDKLPDMPQVVEQSVGEDKSPAEIPHSKPTDEGKPPSEMSQSVEGHREEPQTKL